MQDSFNKNASEQSLSILRKRIDVLRQESERFSQMSETELYDFREKLIALRNETVSSRGSEEFTDIMAFLGSVGDFMRKRGLPTELPPKAFQFPSKNRK